MPNERFLVSGCAGFIGGHMVDRLLGLGYEVVGVDDFSTGTHENLAPYFGRIRFIEGSVCDPAVCDEAVQGVHRVVHLASIPSVPRSIEAPRESAESSIMGTVTLMRAAAEAKVRRFVQASSSAVYGDSPINPRHEQLQPAPMSPYAVAKLTQEYYGRAFSLCYQLDTVSLRYFNVFGPGQPPHSAYAAVIPKFVVRMLEGKRPHIFGNGTQTRDFTSVENVVEANLRAALAPERLGGISLNIGCGKSHTLNGLVSHLNQILGTNLPPIHHPPRLGDVLHSQADVSLAKETIGFSPNVGFEDGLRRVVAALQGERTKRSNELAKAQ